MVKLKSKWGVALCTSTSTRGCEEYVHVFLLSDFSAHGDVCLSVREKVRVKLSDVERLCV